MKKLSEADSSTERVRRYYKRHPDKVKAYLRKTSDDRVERNKARRAAVKRNGKANMKNKDVHHPKGVNNSTTKLVKKDHGRDKKMEHKMNREELREIIIQEVTAFKAKADALMYLQKAQESLIAGSNANKGFNSSIKIVDHAIATIRRNIK